MVVGFLRYNAGWEWISRRRGRDSRESREKMVNEKMLRPPGDPFRMQMGHDTMRRDIV